MFTSSSYPFASSAQQSTPCNAYQQSSFGCYNPFGIQGNDVYSRLFQQYSLTPTPQNYAGIYSPQNPQYFNGPHQMIFQELGQDRNRDLNQDLLIRRLLNALKFSRRSDHVIRHLIQGRPIEKREIVQDILADRVKDAYASEIIDAIIEDKKWNRVLDSLLSRAASGQLPTHPGALDQLMADSISTKDRQRVVDNSLYAPFQGLKQEYLSSQFAFPTNLGGAAKAGQSLDPLSLLEQKAFLDAQKNRTFSSPYSAPCATTCNVPCAAPCATTCEAPCAVPNPGGTAAGCPSPMEQMWKQMQQQKVSQQMQSPMNPYMMMVPNGYM